MDERRLADFSIATRLDKLRSGEQDDVMRCERLEVAKVVRPYKLRKAWVYVSGGLFSYRRASAAVYDGLQMPLDWSRE